MDNNSIDKLIARVECPGGLGCHYDYGTISCKECRKTLNRDVATALRTFKKENKTENE